MSTMQTEVFEAIRGLGVPDDKAMKAAIALSGRDARLDTFDAKLNVSLWAIGLLLAAILASQAMLWLAAGRIEAQWSQVSAQLTHIQQLVQR